MMRRGIQSRLINTTSVAVGATIISSSSTRSMVGHGDTASAATTSAWDTPSWGTGATHDTPSNAWGSGSGRGNGGVQFWGGNTENDQWKKLNSPPTDEKGARSLTPPVVLQTVREDPGMPTNYYARRYFGGATPGTVATLNHIFWSQLKKFGKVTISREPGKEDDPDSLLWMPLRRERGRVTNVRKHRPESEDLELLKDYVEPPPTLEEVVAPIRPRRVPHHHRNESDPSQSPIAYQQQQELLLQQQLLQQQHHGAAAGGVEPAAAPAAAFWGQGVPTEGNNNSATQQQQEYNGGGDYQQQSQYAAVADAAVDAAVEVNNGEQHYQQLHQNGGGASVGGAPTCGSGVSQGGGGQQQYNVVDASPATTTPSLSPASISSDLKATVETVMKLLLTSIHAEPNMSMNHYTNYHLLTDEHRLASSSAFKELQSKNLIAKQRTISSFEETNSNAAAEGGGGKRGIGATGATFTITEEGERVLHSLSNSN